MFDSIYALGLFVGLCGSALAGRALLRVLPEDHRTRESLDFVKNVSGMLLTLTALVLSLLLAAVNADFRKTDSDLRIYGSMIVLLDAELASLGPQTRSMRTSLREYTAAAIASTWPDQPPPSGTYSKPNTTNDDVDSYRLSEALHRIETDVRRLATPNTEAEKAQAACLSRVASLLDQRGILIADAHVVIPPFLFTAMLFWLVIVFFSFGLTAPQNRTTVSSIVIVAVAVAGAVLVISELDGPLDGLVKVESAPLRHALQHLDHAMSASP